jgi:rfaE bifunctional protein nucleotidyltransferase chain/domain
MNHRDKIKNEEELLSIIDSLKQQGKKIVHCHGCFDLLHPGHLRHFEFAKTNGDILVVSITGDLYMSKGFKKPFATENLRAENLAAVTFIDYVIIDRNEYGHELVSKIKPDVYVKGMEYSNVKKNHPGFLKEKEIVENNHGIVAYSPDDLVFSSTNIMNELLERHDFKKEMSRNYLIKHNISKEDILDAIDRFKDSRILLIGDIFFEDRAICEPPSVDDDAPVFNLNVIKEERYVRGVFTLAEYLLKLNINVSLLFVIGKDKRSMDLIHDLNKDNNLNIQYVQLDDYSFPIKRKFLLKKQKIFEVNIGSSNKGDNIGLIEKSRDLIKESNGIVLCDYGYGTISPGFLEFITKESNEKNIPLTIIHSNSKDKKKYLSYDFDFILHTEDEIRNFSNNFTDSLDNISKDILESSRIKNLVIDLGKEGLVNYSKFPVPMVGFLPSYSEKKEKELITSLLILTRCLGKDIFLSLYIANFLHSHIESSDEKDLISSLKQELIEVI